MAGNTLLTGNGAIAAGDYKAVSWAGKTKQGKAVTISLSNAINLGDIDLSFAEKDDTVASLTFTACYTGSEADTSEPWSIIIEDGQTSGAEEILLGAGVFSIGGTPVALTRGGGSFKVTRENRRINADGDRGPVKGRIVCEGSEATLTLNALTFITGVADMYCGVTSATTT